MRILLFTFLTFSLGFVQAQSVPEFGVPSSPGRVIADPPAGGVTSPVLTDDELEIVFESLGNLWSATRVATTVPFENSKPISELSTSEYSEEHPFLSKDGLGLYFTRFKSFPTPTRKVYYARRATPNSPFDSPVEVGIEGVDLLDGELGSVSGDELSLYLEIIQDSDPGSGLPQHTDIAVATRTVTTEKFGMWTLLSEVNTSNLERSPSVTRDERTLYFTLQGVGSPGFIFASIRSSRSLPFSTPSLLTGVNTPGVANRDPFIAFPGSRLYFVRDEDLVFSDRILSGTYQLGHARGLGGRRILLPVSVETPEPDAILFEAPLFFNPNQLTLVNVLPHPALGRASLEIEEISQGRYRILYEAEQPLAGDDEPEKIFDIEFLVGEGLPPGEYSVSSGGTYRLNKIEVPPPTSGGITIVDGPSYPAASLWKLH